ncbi:hypothetical protein HY404_03530 [Candidatus Microgenomates bacterium]|nr:hypothetical protein [Candidatus Microgenomates bacterium]
MPKKLFFASDVDGVFTQDPNLNSNAQLIPEINKKNFLQVIKGTSGSASVIDIGGGMKGKLEEIHTLSPGIETWIINGNKRGILKNLLVSQTKQGTKIIL